MFLAARPQQYTAKATVVVPVPQNAPAAVAFQRVSNFRAAVSSPAGAERVARKTGASLEALESRLYTRQLGTSSIVEVSYTGTSRERVTAVAREGARAGLDLLDEASIRTANEELAAAESAYGRAREAVDQFTRDTGLLLPRDEFRIRNGELSQMRLQLSQARLDGNGSRVAALEALIVERERRLTELTNVLQRYEPLEDRLTQSSRALERARTRMLQATSDLEANEDDSAVSVQPARAVPRLPVVARRTLVVVTTAVILAIGLIVLLEFLGPLLAARSETVARDGSQATQEWAAPVSAGAETR